ncbi:MAG: hypothetical protein ACJ765_12940 [Chloroflexota bacterium]
MRGSTPVHPFLLAAFPVLFLFAENFGETDPAEVVLPLLASLGAASIGYVVLRILLRDTLRAAVLTSLGIAAFFLFGHAENLLATVRLTEGKVLAGWLVLIAIAAVAILRTRRDLGRLTLALNVVSIVLIGNLALTIGLAFRASGAASPPGIAAEPRPTSSASTPNAAPEQLRDIYYIVVEDYGSRHTVLDTLGLPDTGQFEWLAAQGFHVLPETRSNYGRTPLSIASSLNMKYLDDLAAELGPDWGDYGPLTELVRRPAAARYLQERGYRYLQLGSQFRLTSISSIADVNPVFRDTSDFAGVLYDTTILPAIVHRLGLDDGRDGRRKNFDAFEWQLQQVSELTAQPGPKFVFIHLFLPHHPFIVDDDGDYVPTDVDSRRTRREQQATQWGVVDAEVRAIVEPLLAGNDATDPVIVLSTDEGPNPDGMPTVGGDLAWGSATDAELDQKFSIFAAYYLPGVDASALYPTMSSVNGFRLIFNLYFGADYGLLPDRSWIHRDKHHPFDLTDVTSRLDAFAAGRD